MATGRLVLALAAAGALIAAGRGPAAALDRADAAVPLPAPVRAALAAGESGRVARVLDGDTLALDGGLEVRLVGVLAPRPPPDRAAAPWPPGEAAARALAGLAAGRDIALFYGGTRRDRYGRALAHAVTADGTWLQGALVGAGHARVYSFADNRAAVPELLALERAARGARRGLWMHPAYAVLAPAQAERHADSFQLVEGRVLAAEQVRGRAYLNFGPDWRTDFTISVAGRDRRRFADAGIAWADYAGRRVRVRGWLRAFNGPLIEVTHPEQIEVLDR